jgi:hypothetical protein
MSEPMSELRERIKTLLLKTAGGLELYEHERDEIADVLIRELGWHEERKLRAATQSGQTKRIAYKAVEYRRYVTDWEAE